MSPILHQPTEARARCQRNSSQEYLSEAPLRVQVSGLHERTAC